MLVMDAYGVVMLAAPVLAGGWCFVWRLAGFAFVLFVEYGVVQCREYSDEVGMGC